MVRTTISLRGCMALISQILQNLRFSRTHSQGYRIEGANTGELFESLDSREGVSQSLQFNCGGPPGQVDR